MTEALQSESMQHAFPSIPNPPSLNRRTLPPATTQDDLVPQSPPISQTAKPSIFDLSSSNALPAFRPLTDGGELTPPSSSALSSQEQAFTTETQSLDTSNAEFPVARPTAIANDRESTRSSTGSPTRIEVPREFLSGPKRTASGQVKRSSISSINDLKTDLNGTRHSRTSSILSTGSNGTVMELSQQLRTRLNYAMVKVQNGWQSHSLEEVESLASQSPRSSMSGFPNASNRHSLPSPRTAMSANLHRKWSSSESSEGGNVPNVSSADLNGGYVNGKQQYPSSNMMARRALAPPADIVPGVRRRNAPNGSTVHTATNGVFVPTLQLNTSRPHQKQRTPSQNAAMEADAVETLLFMASPNNSGHHPATFAPQESSLRSTQDGLSQTSPLRNQFPRGEALMSPKKVAFATSPIPNGKPFDKNAEIERMLDAFDDDSSDDLEEAFNLAQRQHAAGQVR